MIKRTIAIVASSILLAGSLIIPAQADETTTPKPSPSVKCDTPVGTKVSSHVKVDDENKPVINEVTGNQVVEIRMSGRAPIDKKAGHTIVVKLPANVVMKAQETKSELKAVDTEKVIGTLKTVPKSGAIHIIFNKEIETNKCVVWGVAYEADYDNPDKNAAADENDSSPILWFALGGGLLILGIAVGTFLFLRRKRNHSPQRASRMIDPEEEV